MRGAIRIGGKGKGAGAFRDLYLWIGGCLLVAVVVAVVIVYRPPPFFVFCMIPDLKKKKKKFRRNFFDFCFFQFYLANDKDLFISWGGS